MRLRSLLFVLASNLAASSAVRAEEPAVATQAEVVVGPVPTATGIAVSPALLGDAPAAGKAASKTGPVRAPRGKDGASAKDSGAAKDKGPAKEGGHAKGKSAKSAGRDALPPGSRWHVVRPKQRLGSIAKRYRVGLDALLHANDLSRQDKLQPGTKLLVPARGDSDGAMARAARARLLGVEARPSRADREDEVVLARASVSDREPSRHDTRKAKSDGKGDASWLPYVARPKRKGVVTFLGRDDEWKGRLVGRSGKVLARARHDIERILSASTESPMDDELLRLVARVSDTFGGRPIHVVSGFRQVGAERSWHRTGQALDFWIEGVPLEALRDFCKSLDRVGVGYYPNSRFVHLDVRDRWTYWVDVSANGEEPRYTESWSRPEGDADAEPVRVK